MCSLNLPLFLSTVFGCGGAVDLDAGAIEALEYVDNGKDGLGYFALIDVAARPKVTDIAPLRIQVEQVGETRKMGMNVYDPIGEVGPAILRCGIGPDDRVGAQIRADDLGAGPWEVEILPETPEAARACVSEVLAYAPLEQDLGPRSATVLAFRTTGKKLAEWKPSLGIQVPWCMITTRVAQPERDISKGDRMQINVNVSNRPREFMNDIDCGGRLVRAEVDGNAMGLETVKTTPHDACVEAAVREEWSALVDYIRPSLYVSDDDRWECVLDLPMTEG